MHLMFVLVILLLVQLLAVSCVSAVDSITNITAVFVVATNATEQFHAVAANATEMKNATEEARNATTIVDLKFRERLKMATVTICAIVKDEDLYIDEWLQYHRFLGFDQVHIYDNADNASAYISRLPEKYGYFVKVSHSPGLGKQIPTYSKCRAEGEHSNTWAAFIDIDEFIVLRNHSSIKAFLQDVAPQGGSVVLNWSIMISNGTMRYDPAPVVTRFTLTSAVPNKFVKTIAYLPHVRTPTVHHCYMKSGFPTVDQHGRRTSDRSSHHRGNDREVATLNHYQTKSWEEFNLKRRRGFATSFQSNHVYTNESAGAAEAMAKNYNAINVLTHPVEDTTAREFYLKHFIRTKNTTLLL